jgi:cytoskeletal protein CcmA (bactofilin family)
MHGVLQANAGSTVMVQGTQRGDITGARVVFIATTGVVDGSVYADEVIVAGEVIGEVHASRRAEVHSSGVVIGTILTKAALFLEGARVNGCLRIGSNVNVELGTKPSALGEQMSSLSRPRWRVPAMVAARVVPPDSLVRDAGSSPVRQPVPEVRPLNVAGEDEVVIQKAYRISLSPDTLSLEA